MIQQQEDEQKGVEPLILAENSLIQRPVVEVQWLSLRPDFLPLANSY